VSSWKQELVADASEYEAAPYQDQTEFPLFGMVMDHDQAV
jgi:hypothetical protein